jgi:superfamily II DNA or RNA helicase
MEDYIENGTVEDKDNIMLVNILRARQLAESLKIHDIAEMAEDLLMEGKSVVIFVNFTDTATALAQLLECGKIVGSQTASERQNIIDRFQRDDDRVVVVNIAAGGTGISLHDLRGEYPRVSLISPCYSAKNHVQCLGRIHRNGAKSDTIQKVLFAADSIEETVIKALQRKVENLNALHGCN